MTTLSNIPAAHIAEAQRLVFSVLVQIVDHGRVELGTMHSARLQKVNYLLEGKTVPPEIESRAGTV